MSFYHTFPVTPPRALDVDALITAARATDPTIGIQSSPGEEATVIVKKATDFTAQQITDIQAAIDTAPSMTAQRAAVASINNWSPDLVALVDELIDQLNLLRAAAVPPLPPLTHAALLTLIRRKADPGGCM